ncbi:MAG: hypothetical protein ABEJ82_07545 [Haloplanus sp.]
MSLLEAADRMLVGRDPRLSMRLTGVAGAAFLLTALGHLPPRLVGGLSTPFGLSVPLLVGASVVLAAVGAYLNDGLLVSVALAGGPSLGFYLPLALFDLVYPNETVVWALGTGSGFAVVLGTVGFVVGAGARRLAVRAGVGSAA